jgi:hypothetical protein
LVSEDATAVQTESGGRFLRTNGQLARLAGLRIDLRL